LTEKDKTLQARIVSGSVVLLSGSGLTTGINLAYNIVVARFLGPKGFGHATVVYTILTLISAVTLSFQIIAAKVVAQQPSDEAKSAVYRGFHRASIVCGVLVALVLLLFRQAIANYLNLPDSNLIALLAVGTAFYVPLGTRRGYIQGTYGFQRLATNLVLEGAVRFGGSLLLILLGFGVQGVMAANAAAVAAAYFAIAPKLAGRIPNPLRLSHALSEASQAIVFFSGQVLINNCDIVLVKHFFAANEAGIYAAVAMVGRVIFAFSSAVVNSMFPLVAGTRHEDRKDIRVIATSLLMVLGIGCVLAFGLSIAPAGLWTAFFGSGFRIDGQFNLPYLLALYAITSIVYSLSVVMITFEMSYKIANTSWVQLAFSGLVIAAICRYHSSLREVIFVQLILMGVLFACVALPVVRDLLANGAKLQQPAMTRPMELIRRVSEDEVIAEFLRSDFEGAEFRKYQDTMRELVSTPNFTNVHDNAKRRALLFLRHHSLWKEVPEGTEWYEVQVSEANLDQIRVFPRAQWRKLAKGNFSVTEVRNNFHARQRRVDAKFLNKIDAIETRLLEDDPGFSAVILIGLNNSDPMTVIDGNHRLAAAVLLSPPRLAKLRFFCGLSPHMTECCWYKTNLISLLRYAKHRLMHATRNPDAEVVRICASQNDSAVIADPVPAAINSSCETS
jgi:O-antigen/teichoic acid export membrane protein